MGGAPSFIACRMPRTIWSVWALERMCLPTCTDAVRCRNCRIWRGPSARSMCRRRRGAQASRAGGRARWRTWRGSSTRKGDSGSLRRERGGARRTVAGIVHRLHVSSAAYAIAGRLSLPPVTAVSTARPRPGTIVAVLCLLPSPPSALLVCCDGVPRHDTLAHLTARLPPPTSHRRRLDRPSPRPHPPAPPPRLAHRASSPCPLDTPARSPDDPSARDVARRI